MWGQIDDERQNPFIHPLIHTDLQIGDGFITYKVPISTHTTLKKRSYRLDLID